MGTYVELTANGMSCPVSTSPVSGGLWSVLVEDALECVVPVGVVGGAVLPASPDDVGPGSSEDSYGVGVVVAAGSGSLVEVFGPGAGASQSPAKSHRASRSYLSADQRKVTALTFPD